MKNWKTTLFGALTGFGLLFGRGLSDSTKPLIDFAMIPAAIGAVTAGVVSKDHNVTGGDIKQ